MSTDDLREKLAWASIPTPIYHFTCNDGRRAIGKSGLILPNLGFSGLAWFTDLPDPDRHQLGLTSYSLDCDRMTHRYRVTDTANVVAWADYPCDPPEWRLALAALDGVAPEHWFVATKPVPAVLANVGRKYREPV